MNSVSYLFIIYSIVFGHCPAIGHFFACHFLNCALSIHLSKFNFKLGHNSWAFQEFLNFVFSANNCAPFHFFLSHSLILSTIYYNSSSFIFQFVCRLKIVYLEFPAVLTFLFVDQPLDYQKFIKNCAFISDYCFASATGMRLLSQPQIESHRSHRSRSSLAVAAVLRQSVLFSGPNRSPNLGKASWSVWSLIARQIARIVRKNEWEMPKGANPKLHVPAFSHFILLKWKLLQVRAEMHCQSQTKYDIFCMNRIKLKRLIPNYVQFLHFYFPVRFNQIESSKAKIGSPSRLIARIVRKNEWETPKC